MSEYIKFVKETPINQGFDFPRSSVVSSDLYRIVVNESESTPAYNFGRNPKDIAEFTIYSADNKIVKKKIIKPNNSFIRKTFDFTDNIGVRRVGTISIFNKKYEITNNNELVFSPTHELKELGEESGSFFVGVSMKQELVGSHEMSTKLIIQDISPTRTELKILPSSLKTSNRPSDVALNTEYLNFFNQRIPVSHIYYEIPSMLLDIGLQRHVENMLANGYVIDRLNERLLDLVDFYSMPSVGDFTSELDKLYLDIKKLFLNIFLYKYNNFLKQDDFVSEYELCVDYILKNFEKFRNKLTKKELDNKSLYREILLSLFKQNRLNELYSVKFDSYLSTAMVFETGEIVSVLTIKHGVENINDQKKHQPLILKLQEPLSTDITPGSQFHLNSLIYSDDIIQRVLLYKKSKPDLYKLRSPNLSGIASQGTRSYTAEQLNKNKHQLENNSLLNLETSEPGVIDKIKELENEWREEIFGTPLKITEEISKYFNNQTEDFYLSVDYSDFNNFVKYSSARKRLDVFIYKLTKLSSIDRTLESIRKSWRNSTPEKFSRLSYDSQVEKMNTEKLNILNSFDGYERFLYFEDISELSEDAKKDKERIDELRLKISIYGDNSEYRNEINELTKNLLYTYVSWPRADFTCDTIDDWSDSITDYVKLEPVFYEDSIYILTGNKPPTENGKPSESEYWTLFCECEECAGKKLPLNTESFEFLSNRTYYRPMSIPENMSDFSKTLGYIWYSEKAKEAESYDKYNDNSFINNTPEFITRDEENSDYFEFLSFVGHQFDLIHLYVEGIGNLKRPLNNPTKGVPNEMVSHMLGYFGGNFEGYDEGEINSLAQTVKTEEELNFIKKFKQKKHLVWRRILNNLPYILKTVGTEKSVRAMFRCYGVPDYLFKIREFGGIEYNTETSDKVLYTFDSFDYHLKFTLENQYIELDWKTENYQSKCIEFKFSLDENKCDLTSNVELVSSSKNPTDQLVQWSFGYEAHDTKEDMGWGKFYLQVGDFKAYIKDSSGKEMVYGFSGKDFNVLIQVVESQRWTDSGIEVFVKRYSDEDLVYNGFTKTALPRSEIDKFLNSTSIFLGNYYYSNFYGTLDRLRIYSEPLSEDRFENHIRFNQSYDIENPNKLESVLVFKANFDFPYDIRGQKDPNKLYGIIQNTALRKDASLFAKCFNFKTEQFPYDFGGTNKRNFAKLPAYGSQVFNNSKIRIEHQTLETQLSVSKRSTKKSGDRLTIDTNKLGVYFSPSDLINHEILRFFGDFELGDYIGDPSELYNKTYSGFKEIKNVFFKHGFGKIDFSYYLSILESYLDPSLFKNIEKIIPARTLLISGLVVEPSLLERSKIQRRPVQNELIVYDDVHIRAGIKNKKITHIANYRDYYNIRDEDVHQLNTNLKHATSVSNTYPNEFDYNIYNNIPNDLMYGVNSYRGFSYNSLVTLDEKTYTRYVKTDVSIKNYNALRIFGDIIKNSFFNCELYGEVGGRSLSNFYVHREAEINKISVYGNLISTDKFINGYAKFDFKFSGHTLTGKAFGGANLVIQNGFIENFVVNGRFGGNTFQECDLRLQSSRFTSEISKIILDKKLSGSPIKSFLKSNDNIYKQVNVQKKDSDINLVKVPKQINDRLDVNINKNVFFKLKNNSKKYITATGTYRCKLNMQLESVQLPPPVCTINLEWSQTEKNTNVTKNILNFRKSSYDYVHNIKLEESLDNSKLKNNIELPTLDVEDSTKVTSLQNNDPADYSCEERNGRYRVAEIIKRKKITTDSDILETNIGNITKRKKYYIPFNFSQKLRLNQFHSDVDLKANIKFDGTVFKYNITENAKTLYSSTVSEFEIYSAVFTNKKLPFILKIKSNSTDNFKVGDVVLLKDSSWEYTSDASFDFNEIYYTLREISNIKESTEVGDIDLLELKFDLPTNLVNQNIESAEYIGGGIIYKLPTKISFDYNKSSQLYNLKMNVAYNNDLASISMPAKLDKKVNIGDIVNIVFRDGAFLWKEYGIRVLENAEVVKISKLNDRLSNLNGEDVLLLKLNSPINNTDNIEIIPSADYVYAFEVNSSKIDKNSNYSINFTTDYDIQLGPSPSPLAIQKINRNLLVENSISINSQFKYFNLYDLNTLKRKVLTGPLKTHRRNFNSIDSREPRKLSRLHCRKSSSNLNNTISANGVLDVSPPIVRTRKTALRNGMGDSFWYLEDKSYSVILPCGVSDTIDEDNYETITQTQTLLDDELDLDSLVLHYTFENVDNGVVTDNSDKKNNGILNNAVIRDGGPGRPYKKVLLLDNNTDTNSENTKRYVEVEQQAPFETRKCTISLWIRPIGESADNTGIIFNNSIKDNELHGLVLNPNGNRLSIGYAWKNSTGSHIVDLNVGLSEDTWSHLCVVFYEIGIVRVFLDKVYVKSYDLGVEHESVLFDKLEIGRFSGMIDDIRIYTDELPFGDVSLKSESTEVIGKLYDNSRINENIPITEYPRCAELPFLNFYEFKYLQERKFTEASVWYRENENFKEDPTLSADTKARMKFSILGGPNEGNKKFATTEFMGKLCGPVIEAT